MSRTTFLIEQGETFYRRIEYKDSNNQPVDLTDYHSRMQIRPNATSTTVYCTLSSSLSADGSGINMTPYSGSTTLPKSSGSLSLNISAYSSSLFTFDTAEFDLFIISGSGISTYQNKILEGKVKLKKSVTR